MTTVTREHLAGLELALQRLSRHLAPENKKALNDMIAQASAAPEQEAAAWTWQGTLERLKRGFCPEGEVVWPHKGPGAPIALYTRPDADIERPECFCVEHGLPIEELQQKLAEAQALLRDWLNTPLDASSPAINDLRRKTDYMLSATAQPAEVKS